MQYGEIKKAPGSAFCLLLGVSLEYAGQEDDKAEHRQDQGMKIYFSAAG